MLKVTYIDYHGKSDSAAQSGWYITDASGAIIDGSQCYEDQASGLRPLMALSWKLVLCGFPKRATSSNRDVPSKRMLLVAGRQAIVSWM
jgi:hypothetical protein